MTVQFTERQFGIVKTTFSELIYIMMSLRL